MVAMDISVALTVLLVVVVVVAATIMSHDWNQRACARGR
jgi:hypothetical protein